MKYQLIVNNRVIYFFDTNSDVKAIGIANKKLRLINKGLLDIILVNETLNRKYVRTISDGIVIKDWRK